MLSIEPPVIVATRTIQQGPNIDQFYQRVCRSLDRMPAELTLEVGDEATNARTFTFRAVDKNRGAVICPCLLHVWVATTAGGAPGGTQTAAWGTGVVVQEIAANQAWLVRTDGSGVAVLTLTVSGAGTRYVSGSIGGPVLDSGAVAWA